MSPECHPERTVRLRLFVPNAQGSSLISLGTQIRKARDVGEQFGDKLLVFAVPFLKTTGGRIAKST